MCGDALSGSDRVLESGTIGFDWRNYKDFDCIVGNPPYVEVKDRTKYSHFNSVNCGNLYAYAIERSCNIAHLNSMISFIVPLPLISTSRMNDIKTYLERKSSIYGHGKERYNYIKQVFAEQEGNHTNKTAWDALKAASQDPSETDITSNTQWSIVFDNTNLTAEIVLRRNWNDVHKFSVFGN